MNLKAPVLISAVLLAGCASNDGGKTSFKQMPTVDYRAPTNPPAPAVIFDVPGSVPQTVAKVIESLNGPRFGITHVDQQRGLVTATFEADPDDFLDCGEIETVSSQGEATTVPAASRHLTYEVPINDETRIGSIDRRMTLDGRLVVEVTPGVPGRSNVQVSGDYVLTRKAALKGTASQTLRDETRFLAFGSGQAVSFGSGSTVCQSNGELEQLALVQGDVGVASASLGPIAETFAEAPQTTVPAAPAGQAAVTSPGGSAPSGSGADLGQWTGSTPGAVAAATPVPSVPQAQAQPQAQPQPQPQPQPQRLKRSTVRENPDSAGPGRLQDVRAEFAKLGCAPLTAIEDSDGVRISGFVGSQEELDELKESVRSLEDVGDVTFQVVVTSASFCEILQVTLPLHERNSIESAGASIGVDGSAIVLQEGDAVILEANAPNFPSYAYIIYMQEDGKLLNLMPSVDHPDNSRTPNEQFSIGDKPDQPSFTVSPPYGDDLVMLLASSEPLFDQPRPLIEYGSSFAEDLSKSVEAILSNGGRVVADLVFLRTSPRSS